MGTSRVEPPHQEREQAGTSLNLFHHGRYSRDVVSQSAELLIARYVSGDTLRLE
jgi:hypothetical protein